MPSTYSPELRIELIANGDQSGSWGNTTNSNLGTIIEAAIAGTTSVSVTTANQALTALNGAPDQARNAVVELTTTTVAPFNVYIPPSSKLYVIKNSSAYAATVYCSTVLGNTTAGGTGVTIPSGKTCMVWTMGTDVAEQLNHIVGAFSTGGNVAVGGNATVAGTLAVTGTTTLSDDLILNGSSGTAGQVVVSQGTGVAPAWGNAFVAGMIMMWSGSIATIPTGWLLCDGTNSTPNLRDRFVVGAGSTYAVAATGGSADAVVVSHTHTATVTDPGHKHQAYVIPSFSGGGYGANWNVDGPFTWPNGQSTSLSSNMQNATTGISVANSTTGVSGTNANLPPYYALAYIMKA